ncbi:helix-turn-helix transcriptional regulator [Xiamenia xianingshaonis]|uniref:helix-turn-helix transcriptional regulator n=1 Tax=Xiamenia xianingshaonis TaxID=2682776 RepID=UPI0021BD985A|nr:LuxR C-terminal-related transcriptional regulator [Xiamenia xianingshaonis]
MERLVDKIMVIVLCLPLMASSFHAYASPVALLCAVGLTLATEFPLARPVRFALIGAFGATCAAFGPFFAFLPLAAYLLTSERTWAVRSLWLVAWAAGAVVRLAGDAATATFSILVGLTCAVAALLAVRTFRLEQTLLAFHHTRDGMRESVLDLLKQNESLAQAETRPTSGDASGEDAKHAGNAGAADAETCLRFADLTERENSIVALVAEGLDNREIAARLYLSEGTVRNAVSAVLQKKGLKNRTQIAIMFYRDAPPPAA